MDKACGQAKPRLNLLLSPLICSYLCLFIQLQRFIFFSPLRTKNEVQTARFFLHKDVFHMALLCFYGKGRFYKGLPLFVISLGSEQLGGELLASPQFAFRFSTNAPSEVPPCWRTCTSPDVREDFCPLTHIRSIVCLCPGLFFHRLWINRQKAFLSMFCPVGSPLGRGSKVLQLQMQLYFGTNSPRFHTLYYYDCFL